MKKFFTLIAVALVAISASAQETELKAQVNASFDRKSNDDAALMAPFKSVETVNGVKTSANSPAQSRVVKDPADADMSDRTANWCIEVCSRSVEDAAAAGDAAVTNNQPLAEDYSNFADWDTQFFITLPDGVTLEAGAEVTFSMRVKAEVATETSFSTQAHLNPGGYKHYDMCGGVTFTTGWTDFKKTWTVSSNQDGTNTIAINLGKDLTANKFYFDDIKWELPAPKVYDWVNIYENDGTDLSSLSVKYFKNYTDAAKSENGAIVVTSLDPDKTYAEYYMEDGDGNAVDAKLANDWDTQFLVSLPVALKAGQKFQLSFKYWADEAATANTQAHLAAPAAGAVESKGLGQYPEYAGTYKHYELAGNVSFTDKEQTFEKVVTVPDNAAGMGAICFNLSVLRKSINYYFDDIKVAIEREDVPTAISEVKAQKIARTIYNVAGQQIQSLQKGLNIVNGQKVYVK